MSSNSYLNTHVLLLILTNKSYNLFMRLNVSLIAVLLLVPSGFELFSNLLMISNQMV